MIRCVDESASTSATRISLPRGNQHGDVCCQRLIRPGTRIRLSCAYRRSGSLASESSTDTGRVDGDAGRPTYGWRNDVVHLPPVDGCCDSCSMFQRRIQRFVAEGFPGARTMRTICDSSSRPVASRCLFGSSKPVCGGRVKSPQAEADATSSSAFVSPRYLPLLPFEADRPGLLCADTTAKRYR